MVHVGGAYPALGPAIGYAAEYGAVEEEAQVLLDKVVAGHDTSGLTAPVTRRLLPGPAASALLGAPAAPRSSSWARGGRAASRGSCSAR